MIKLTLKDKELAKDPKVQGYIDIMQKLINDKFPKEKLNKIREHQALCYATGLPFIMDENGNIIDPATIFQRKEGDTQR